MAANGGKNSPKQISQQVDELNKKLGVTQGKLEDINQTLTVTQAQSQKATQRVSKNLKDINATLVSLQKEARAADARLARMVITGDAIRKSLVNGMTQSSTAMTTAAVSADRMNAHLHKTNMTTQDVVMNARRMTTAFQYAFALNPITMFLRKMIEVRGEFEMQGVALQAILQNKDEADKLFNQITQLAVKSPFRVKDLLTYTKQLAAYRIETDQLYDTTKRLADVSAGLGVDMGRLILAYGQVKAANYLRASEIRQFTEAGVNMLGELATYFTETGEKMVSTADVMNMVQKRMVSFEDVAEVFRRMTNEGGIFYDMQEKQSYTVQGQIGKLKDSIDLMLNDIGTAQQGAIKDAVTGLTDLLKHWEDVWYFMKTIVAEIAVVKGAQMAYNVVLGKTTGLRIIDNAVTRKQIAIMRASNVETSKLKSATDILSATYGKKRRELEQEISAEDRADIIYQRRVANIEAVLTEQQKQLLSIRGITTEHERYVSEAMNVMSADQRMIVAKNDLTNNQVAYVDALRAARDGEIETFSKRKKGIEEQISAERAHSESLERSVFGYDMNIKKIDKQIERTNAEIASKNRSAAQYRAHGNAIAATRVEKERDALVTQRDTLEEKKAEIQRKRTAAATEAEAAATHADAMQTRLDTQQTRLNTIAKKMQTVAVNGLKRAFVGLRAVMGGAIFGIALTALTGLVTKLTEGKREADELKKNLEEVGAESKSNTSKQITDFKRLVKTILDTNTSYKEQQDALSALKREFEGILPMHELEIEALREKNGEYSELIDVIREYNVELERQKKIEAVQEGFDFTGAEKDLAEKIAQGINNDNRTNSVFKDITTSVNEILPIIQSVTNDVKQGVIEAGDASDEIMNRIGEHFAVTASEVKESLQATEEAASTFGEFWDWIWGSTFTGKLDKYLDKVYDFAGQIYNVNKDYTSALKKETQQYFDDYDRMVDEWNDAWGDAHSEEEERIRRGKEKLKEIAEELNLNIDWDKELNAVGFKETADRMFKFGVKNALISALEDLQKRLSSNVLIRQVQVIIDKLKGEAANFAADPSFEAVRNNLQKFVDDNNVTGENLKKLSKQLLMEQGESMDKYASRLNNLRKAAKSFNDTYLQIAKTNAQLAAQNKAEYEYNLLLIKAIDSQIGAEQKKTSGTKQTENLNAQISLLKELNSEYNKLLKNYDAETAKMKIMASYTDAVAASFKAINKKYKTNFSIADIDFTSEEGMAASLAKLREVAAKMGDDAKAALEKAISPFVAEIEVKPIVKNREQFKKEMDDILDDYNKSNEARGLGLSSSMASTVFGVNNTNTATMRKKLEQYADKYLRNDAGQFYGEEGRKEYEKWLEKINDLEDKAVQERMKKYVKYLNQSYTEVAAARVKLMQQFLEIDNLDIEESVKEQMKAGAKTESDKAIGKAMWQQFKDSDMYVDLFADLENASTRSIDAMIEKLRGLGEEMKQLDPTHLKDIQTQIQKLEKVKMERSPLASLVDYYKQMRELQAQGHTEEFIDTQLDAKRTSLEEYINLQSQSQTLAAAAEQGILEQVASQEELNMLSEMGLTTQADIAEYYRESANEAVMMQNIIKGDINQLKQEKSVYDGLRKTSKSFASNWKSVSNTMKSSWNEAFDVFEAVGGELNNEQKAYKEVGNAILDVIAIIPTYVAGMTAAGVAINSAMGIIGLIAEAISLTMGLIKALAGMNDAKQQDKIDDLSEKVRQLEQDFEDLEEAMEHAMNSTDYLKSYEDALDNIDERIQKTREMADAERAKKDTDEEKLQEYADNVRDLEKEREELKQKLIEDWGGLGRDNWRSMAEDFVSAWMDAFEETGDGLEGLEKKFDEWLKNWFQKQATMKVASAMLEPLFTMIDEMTDKDHGLGLDTNEMEQIRQKAAEIFPQLNESLKEMWEAFDMGGGAVDSLTGLQQGIEGITEATAEVIEGYLNSIRYFVAEDNAILIQIRDSIVGGVAGSGIADNVASMRNLLEQINNKLPDMTPFANQGGVMGLNVRIVE